MNYTRICPEQKKNGFIYYYDSIHGIKIINWYSKKL